MQRGSGRYGMREVVAALAAELTGKIEFCAAPGAFRREDSPALIAELARFRVIVLALRAFHGPPPPWPCVGVCPPSLQCSRGIGANNKQLTVKALFAGLLPDEKVNINFRIHLRIRGSAR